ncbi:hypothetical protein KUCAC02_025440 [Chaenocephalus aceratus]|uniref:Uncharacterized protein n=1 Tax=Chaenocephalus aceratus TaxID=36190 RepID=A0ACB9VVM9_CHAAC|nr:hypothetical protein KUCAC02_025440 [Chaenocephalus aceratus]
MKAVTLHRQLVSYESLTSDPPEVGSGYQKYQASTVLVPLYRGLRLTTGGGSEPQGSASSGTATQEVLCLCHAAIGSSGLQWQRPASIREGPRVLLPSPEP